MSRCIQTGLVRAVKRCVGGVGLSRYYVTPSGNRQLKCLGTTTNSVLRRSPTSTAASNRPSMSHRHVCHPAVVFPKPLNDDITCRIIELQSTNELMNLAGVLATETLTPDHSWLLTKQLLYTHYAGLTKQLQWLQDNIHIAHIQLHLRGSVVEMARPIIDHPNYAAWYQLVDRDCSQMTGDQLAECLLALLYLGIKEDDPLLHRLLILSHESLPSFSLNAVATMSTAIKALPGFDFYSIKEILRRINLLPETIDVEKVTPNDVTAVCLIIINTFKFQSDENIDKLMTWLLKYLQSKPMSRNPDDFGIYLRLGKHVLMNSETAKQTAYDIVRLTMPSCHGAVESMTPAHIAEMCHSIKVFQCYDNELARLCEKQAESLLTEDCRLSDVTNLMYALTRNSPQLTIQKFEGALHSRLLHGDVDIIILSNIADNLINTSLNNPDLIAIFHRHVADQAHDIIKFITRYNKVVKLLVRRRFVDRELEARFTEKLMDHVEHQHGIHTHTISSLAAFLIPTSYNVLPQVFFDKLIAAIPKWRMNELCRLAQGLNMMRYPKMAGLQRQRRQILSLLHDIIIEKLDTIEMFDHLQQLSLSLVVHSRNRDPTLSDRLLAMYPMFTKNLNEMMLTKVVQVFQSLGYHLPEVYNDLVKFVIESRDEMKDARFLSVLSACAKIGYQPDHLQEFTTIMCAVYKNLFVQRDMKTAISLLNQLSTLQSYPEKELAELFTLEVIEELERYIKVNGSVSQVVERELMELNRSVVLECPQLDVPWFHEQYCLDTVVRVEPAAVSLLEEKLKEEVEQALCEVMGGNSFVKRWSYSPYYYEIDFECALNKKGKPVKMSRLALDGSSLGSSSSATPEYQKVAVCVLPETSYCYNSKHLIGQELTRKRHLEIMQYKYIEVPFFDWYSMGLSDWQAKVDYLETRVMAR